MPDQSRNDLPFECFQMEAVNVLTELQSCHETKKRQIDRVFNVLFDNLPEDLKNAPINGTLEKLLTLARKKINSTITDKDSLDDNTVHQDIIEDSLTDFSDDKLVKCIFIVG